jgi:hypothetical protein
MSFLPSYGRPLSIPVAGVFISGANADRAVVAVPFGIRRWVPRTTYVYCENASATLAAASIEMWTTGSSGNIGTSLMVSTPTTLANLTTTGQFQSITGIANGAAFTTTGILIRQNAAAAGAASGSIYVGIEIMPLG